MFYLLTDQMNSAEVIGSQWLNKQLGNCDSNAHTFHSILSYTTRPTTAGDK